MTFHNHCYPWTEVHADGVTCWMKGTFFYENELLRGVDVVHLLSSALEDSQIDHEALKALLLALNGNFPLALETPWYIFCTVAVSGVFPSSTLWTRIWLSFQMMRTASGTA